jgi:hypothetical protein
MLPGRRNRRHRVRRISGRSRPLANRWSQNSRRRGRPSSVFDAAAPHLGHRQIARRELTLRIYTQSIDKPDSVVSPLVLVSARCRARTSWRAAHGVTTACTP